MSFFRRTPAIKPSASANRSPPIERAQDPLSDSLFEQALTSRHIRDLPGPEFSIWMLLRRLAAISLAALCGMLAGLIIGAFGIVLALLVNAHWIHVPVDLEQIEVALLLAVLFGGLAFSFIAWRYR